MTKTFGITKKNPGFAGVVGVVVGAAVLIVAALFIGAWVAMLVFGALAANSEFVNYTPGFWETFFGLWSIGVVGSAFNSTKIKVDTDK